MEQEGGMTYKELLESKKKDLKLLIKARERGLEAIGSLIRIEKIETTIKALEKQIPAEVTEFAEFSHDGSSFYKLDFLCPGCGHAVYGQPYKPNFCKECGQALDWSE